MPENTPNSAEPLGRPGRPQPPERPGYPEQPEKPNKPERPNRPDRPERPEKPDRPKPPDRPDRPDRPRPPIRPELPLWPDWPAITPPLIPWPDTAPSVRYGRVRFLNASVRNGTLEVLVDGLNVLSGSSFATISVYTQVADGFHNVTIRQTGGPILYQQTLAFISGEPVTMVILDTAGGVTVSRVSDAGCTNLPSGYGCVRAVNMSYAGSNYDIRLYNNQIVFAGLGYKEVSSFKQASAGDYSFFVTGAQNNLTSFDELPRLILSVIAGTPCAGCAVSSPLLTYNAEVQAGLSCTSYIIGNPWSGLYQVMTVDNRDLV